MNYKKVVVVGGGVLGSQIAFQTAYCGYEVVLWLRSKESIKRAKVKIDKLKETYIDTIKEMNKSSENWALGISEPDDFNEKKCLEKVNKAYEAIVYEIDLLKALKDADLVIESLSENVQDKIEFYQKINPILDEKTVVVTNSSTLLPSIFAKHTGRPEKFLALHFANSIWKNNTAEVMSQKLTSKCYFDEIIEFAKSIRMVPLPITKEKSGYLLNSMLVPFLLSGLDLYANGISDPQSIDAAWTRGTGAPKGPFQIMDAVGLVTAKNIVEQYQKVPGLINPLLKKMMLPYNYKEMLRILNKYIEEGKTGQAVGEGFYKYKN